LPVPTPHQLRFGAFELDRQTAELYKNGTKLKLQGQPIAVLALLLERPGQLVTREELRKYLWPEDTFVDFEHILNPWRFVKCDEIV
jgi:DNA-binding winged helix-turn-helix (wHTH) protein